MVESRIAPTQLRVRTANLIDLSYDGMVQDVARQCVEAHNFTCVLTRIDARMPMDIRYVM